MATADSSCMQVISSGRLLPPSLMIDSCRPRKLDPGLAATYSKPSDFSTSTMKSEPLRWFSPRTCTSPGPIASPAAVMRGVVGAGGAGEASGADGVDCAVNSVVEATMAAAPASAPFCRNSRRSSCLLVDFLDPLTFAPPDRASGRIVPSGGPSGPSLHWGYDTPTACSHRDGNRRDGLHGVRLGGIVAFIHNGTHGRGDARAGDAGLPCRCAMQCAVQRNIHCRAGRTARRAVSVRCCGPVHCLSEARLVQRR